MKRECLIVIILICFKVSGQTSLNIKNIDIFNINIKNDKNSIVEGENEGPKLYVKFSILNGGDSIVKLYPSKSNIYINYKYNNKYYGDEVFPLLFIENDTLELIPKHPYEWTFNTNFFLGTDIIKKSGNYLLELIETLPTIKIIYKDPESKIISSEIENVNVKEY